MEITKEIVIAMIENGYINISGDTDKNIELVKKAIDEIYKQISKTKNNRSVTINV